MRMLVAAVALLGATAGFGPRAHAQSFPTGDSTIRRIWAEGMERSQAYPLAQALLDSIGPRLTGSPGLQAGHDWLIAKYRSWGIPARNERYGTWRGWRRGITHIDLIAPRVRTLNGMLHAWSPGTGGKDITAPVIIVPEVRDSAAFVAWLPRAKGQFVLIAFPQPTCRPDANWEKFATPESLTRMKQERDAAREKWEARLKATGYPRDFFSPGALGKRLEAAGAAGVITSGSAAGWGRMALFHTLNQRVPSFQLTCEDYGLVFRLAERNQGPRLRLRAEAQSDGEVPVFNTIAELRGVEKPDEYVILSAHLDSWDAASGATDNGTGTVTMLEAMRILKAVYLRPKRTILVGHWAGEEQEPWMNGSRAFVADHPKIMKGVQVVYNQDSGTGRIGDIMAGGMIAGSGYLARWSAHLPEEIGKHLTWTFPGSPGGSGDYHSFQCAGVLALRLGPGAAEWEYTAYTWHTTLDTFDKIVFDDVKHNVTLTAMLAYLASEDPTLVPRERRVFTPDDQGRLESWPDCQPPARTSAHWFPH
jgi:carboxypeptidase Q